MEITFTRSGERTYSSVAVRDDKVRVWVPGYDHPDWLPHDLIHFVIENSLGLQYGFWGRVAAGAVFSGMKILEGRQLPHAAERSYTAVREQPRTGTQSEVLVGLMAGVAQMGIENDWPRVQKMLRQAWVDDHSEYSQISQGEVKRVCAELRIMEQRWQNLPVGEDLTVTWHSPKLAKAGGRKR
ncbi:MAG: hypothetical protein J0I20_20480 [Chloroflexi bacterium]|nr:hypothetical protein [Chloroflexota bacterium]OJV89932.1 MAG: hypothetical protein BGO39_34360 [Chloroflexi bacterium 54-19]